jgi:hypothetical protein
MQDVIHISGAYTMIAETKLAFSKIISKKCHPNSDMEAKFVKALKKLIPYTEQVKCFIFIMVKAIAKSVFK